MRVILVMLALVTALPLPTQRGSAAAAEPFNIEKAVAGAKSPADHEAIAAYYDREGAAAHAKAEEHRKMALTYRHLSISGRVQFPESRCRQLVQYYENVATEDAARAAAHRQMAREAAQSKP
jgi:hypothetical protein